MWVAVVIGNERAAMVMGAEWGVGCDSCGPGWYAEVFRVETSISKAKRCEITSRVSPDGTRFGEELRQFRSESATSVRRHEGDYDRIRH